MKIWLIFLFHFRYYVDHKRKRTHWIHPLARETLPRGWIKRYDEVNGVVYVKCVLKLWFITFKLVKKFVFRRF